MCVVMYTEMNITIYVRVSNKMGVLYVCRYVCIRVDIYKCGYIDIRVYMYVFRCTCMCVYVYMNINIERIRESPGAQCIFYV